MAFDQSNFAPVGAQAVDAPGIYSYISSDDTATVTAAGYLGDKYLQLNNSDIVLASLSDGYKFLQLSGANLVDVSPSGGGSFDPTADQTITGTWTFNTAGKTGFLWQVTDDPSFASPQSFIAVQETGTSRQWFFGTGEGTNGTQAIFNPVSNTTAGTTNFNLAASGGGFNAGFSAAADGTSAGTTLVVGSSGACSISGGTMTVDSDTTTLVDATTTTTIDSTAGTTVTSDATVTLSAGGNISLTTGAQISFTATAGIFMTSLPTSDPSSAGQLWNNSGTLSVSAG